MHARNRIQARAFTLVELLTVIAIIALLIGMLVPAIANARNQAKVASTRGKLKAIGDGCEMFHGEMSKYPQSHGGNPFESSSYTSTGAPAPKPSVFLTGAQWLALQVSGPDLRGFVKPDRMNDSDANSIVNQDDWLHWYDDDWQVQNHKNFVRSGPYVTAEGRFAQTPTIYKREQAFVGDVPASLSKGGSGAGGSVWSNDRLAFFVDAFGFPLLYYVASPEAAGKNGQKQIVSTDLTKGEYGIYDQSDNAVFTGSDGGNGFYTTKSAGWDLGTGVDPDPAMTGLFHPLGKLGFSASATTTFPPTKSFTYCIFDRNLFETTNKTSDPNKGGRVWPRKADTFLLVAPGPDGRYGTLDDVWNF